MVPVLGREVEEGEQSFPVLGQAGDRLLVLGAVFVGEHVDGGLGGRAGRRSVNLAKVCLQYAVDDAVFTADGGSPTVWVVRHTRATGKRRTIVSLTHGTMANAMPQALGAKKAAPDRQVISLSGDGGLSMLLGNLITAVQEKIPIKIAVINNGSLGFVELEMKVEGLLDSYTNLDNPDFARVAQAIGFHAQRVERPEETARALSRRPATMPMPGVGTWPLR
jgi:thiamine pyrophosphate-dependent acetolactate synthase large subunit-like protein